MRASAVPGGTAVARK